MFFDIFSCFFLHPSSRTLVWSGLHASPLLLCWSSKPQRHKLESDLAGGVICSSVDIPNFTVCWRSFWKMIWKKVVYWSWLLLSDDNAEGDDCPVVQCIMLDSFSVCYVPCGLWFIHCIATCFLESHSSSDFLTCGSNTHFFLDHTFITVSRSVYSFRLLQISKGRVPTSITFQFHSPQEILSTASPNSINLVFYHLKASHSLNSLKDVTSVSPWVLTIAFSFLRGAALLAKNHMQFSIIPIHQ